MAFKMKYEKGEGFPYKTDSPTRFLKGVGRKIRGAIHGALGGAFGGDNNLAFDKNKYSLKLLNAGLAPALTVIIA